MEPNTDMQLGGNIVLTGFKELDNGSLLILRKIIGNYARRMSDNSKGFEKLSLTLKHIHEVEKNKKFELHAKAIDSGNLHTAECTDKNVFIAVDTALKKVSTSMGLK